MVFGKNLKENMKRIDIFGVPGSGKTTIYKLLQKKREGMQWYTSNEALKKVFKTQFGKKKFSTRDYLLWLISLVHPSDKLVPHDRYKYKNFIKDNISSKNFLIETCLKNFSKDKVTEPYLKAKRIEYLLNTLIDLIILEKYIRDDIVLCDESLTGRLFSYVLDINNENEIEILKNVNTPIFPNGYILLQAPPEIIIRRINSRERVTWEHRGWSTEEIYQDIKLLQEKFLNAHYLLSNLNVKGIVIDTSLPESKCINQISKYLKTIKN